MVGSHICRERSHVDKGVYHVIVEGLNICREHWCVFSGGGLSIQGLVLSLWGVSCPSGGCPVPLRGVLSLRGGVPPVLTLSPPAAQDCQELTDVERAIETVINQFHCYAVKGQKEYLTPNEMQELVVQKLPHLGKVRGGQGETGWARAARGTPQPHHPHAFSAPSAVRWTAGRED